MKITSLLIANRGEIAIRVARAAAELGIRSVAVYSSDDERSLHIRAADASSPLKGLGPAAYLDGEQVIATARAQGCTAVHPGYGFLSENTAFARRCREEGLVFVGPSPEILELFGDKVRARALASRCEVPLLAGTPRAADSGEIREFFSSLGPGAAIMIKAVAGGGGRGMRAVHRPDDIEEACERCRNEALAACGLGEVYAERLVLRPRHIEVQVLGDGLSVVHFGERDCTMQRRNQKLIEVSPSPWLSGDLRERITAAALRMASEARFKSLGTFEFLVDADNSFSFLEVNPRLQVEHTVTEEVTGVDLVKAQIEVASGRTLKELGFQEHAPLPRSCAMQLRINMETLDGNGRAVPSSGVIKTYEVPTGPGIRIDGCGYSGCEVNPAFDSLLAKLIVRSGSGSHEDLLAKVRRALAEFRIEGVSTNIPFLLALLSRPEVIRNEFHTRFIEENAAILAEQSGAHRASFFETPRAKADAPLPGDERPQPGSTVAIRAPMQGRIVSLEAVTGDAVAAGRVVAVMEAMKIEHEVKAEKSGFVREIRVSLGEVVSAGQPLLFLEEAEVEGIFEAAREEADLDAVRADLAEVLARHAFCLDEARPEAVSRRHARGQRTARENVEDLCDPGSFIEYGALLLAAQRRRRPVDELVRATPADGLITGVGTVNAGLFGEERARCMFMAYDFTVLAGTQGIMNHKKMDRMISVARDWNLPVVLFAEGGGGRPSDTDANVVSALDITTFTRFAGLSGKAPLVGIVSGRCFAGNAALLGCCDVIIASCDANIGMGGPAMIEGGGLGATRPEEIGPIGVQTRNGVVDIDVPDETAAVAAAKQYLSYFQGPVRDWDAADQRLLRRLIPENRLRVYDMRRVIETLSDTGSMLELRRHFGTGMITALIRIEGRPFGVIANNPMHLGGAIDVEGADKASRFMQLCGAYGLPILTLCDTPGFMVGPEIESRAQVRHVCRMFVNAANAGVPFFTVVTRKGYGLGAQAMAGGSFHSPFFIASWPTGEFGAMGLEGAVRLAFRKELQAMEKPEDRDAFFNSLVSQAYELGKAINTASYLEIDSVIDPADTRRWVLRGLMSVPPSSGHGQARRFIDTW